MSTLRDDNRVKAEPAASAFQIAIVDRDSMTSDLLAAALAQDQTYSVRVFTCEDLMKNLNGPPLDLLVIAADAKLHTRTGLDLAANVTRAHPGTAVVVLLNHSSRDAVVNSFRCGARGVFSREESVAEFIACIQHVRKGLMWAGSRETSILLEAFRSLPAPSPVMAINAPALTGRELQVVQHAATGKTNRAIAADLGLSEHTVKNYLFRAFEKLGVSSRIELLFYLTLRGYTFGGTSHGAFRPELENKDAFA